MAIKRHLALQEYSKDHHQALLLCWKIQVGFSKGIAAERIKAYSDWFYENHILEHFQKEEKYMFPVLGSEHKLIVQALEEHKILLALFTDTAQIEDSLKQIQTLLKAHIRFEEQILFNEIQSAATPQELEKIAQFHKDEKYVDNLNDIFWK
ncbi:MAG: hemerythrin domain-containing protein [Lutibacter sp.]|jgi:iron-sulfur cluster repair protein YtfE (RIC family)|nr:hemerythrin domain-containing protein [Lutibacter sp.]